MPAPLVYGSELGPVRLTVRLLKVADGAGHLSDHDDVISYDIEITNTGNVTWPSPPTITDALTSDEIETQAAKPYGRAAPRYILHTPLLASRGWQLNCTVVRRD